MPAGKKNARGKGNSSQIVAARRTKSLELRLIGFTYRQIAEMLKVDVRTAYNDVMDAVSELDKITEERAEKLRDLDVMRLDRMMTKLHTKVNTGDVASIQTMVRLMERKAKLLGLDATTGLGKMTAEVKGAVTKGDPTMTFTLSFEKHPDADLDETE